MRDDIDALVQGLRPFDDLEARHQRECLAWLSGTDDVFRRVPPRTPSPHLVAYIVIRDERDGSLLLADHRKSGLWLPCGGHVEPGEHPVQTVRREVVEELGVPAEFTPEWGEQPVFLTVTPTVGPVEDRHTDVSLWFVLAGSRDQTYTPDPVEFQGIRWWSTVDIMAADPAGFDPHLGRLVAKLAMSDPVGVNRS